MEDMTEQATWHFSLVCIWSETIAKKILRAFADEPKTIVYEKFGYIIVECTREAVHAEDALAKAVGCMEEAGCPIHVVEPSNLVGLDEIRDRSRLDWGHLYALACSAGNDEDSFPRPVARISTNRPLWNLAEVAPWMLDQGMFPAGEAELVQAIESLNRQLVATRAA